MRIHISFGIDLVLLTNFNWKFYILCDYKMKTVVRKSLKKEQVKSSIFIWPMGIFYHQTQF